MELQPPALILGQQAAEELLSLDEQFTHVLIRLMQDEIAACTAVGALLDDSAGTSQQYKQEASETTYNAARSLHKRELAEQLDVQAASWQLLQTLYCSSETPAGACSAVAPDAAACLTWRQQCSELVNSDPMLRRYKTAYTAAMVVGLPSGLAASRTYLYRALRRKPAPLFALLAHLLCSSTGGAFNAQLNSTVATAVAAM
eukprot:GHRR01035870.1.p1 GENE.GHRR01035870.1~~GHRR01035870.1.p1  ORF type:complete len:201 (+),score=57.32 GHRR01035870.1:192-794(+)